MGATFDDIPASQKTVGQQDSSGSVHAADTPATTKIALRNTTTSANVYVTVTGLDTSKNNARWLLRSDGVTGYWPASPSTDHAPLGADCSVVLGGPGSVRTITVPKLVGARIYFARDKPLYFELNRGDNGASLVEPSITNPSDKNYDLAWDFCEFTYDNAQLFVNITYVDFASIPTALQLESTGAGQAVQRVTGLRRAAGLDDVCQQLKAQQAKDSAGWASLVIPAKDGTNLRALSPLAGMVLKPGLFAGYYEPYVDAVWDKYRTADLRINTQVQWGTLAGRVTPTDNQLTFPGVGAFPKPSTRDIFACDGGAFARRPEPHLDEMANITARLAAAFNRSTLLVNSEQPDGERAATYYGGGGQAAASRTNHYARILHAANADGRGYAFPYDDVGASGAADQAGTVASGQPRLLTVFIGGLDGTELLAAAEEDEAAAAENGEL